MAVMAVIPALRKLRSRGLTGVPGETSYGVKPSWSKQNLVAIFLNNKNRKHSWAEDTLDPGSNPRTGRVEEMSDDTNNDDEYDGQHSQS